MQTNGFLPHTNRENARIQICELAKLQIYKYEHTCIIEIFVTYVDADRITRTGELELFWKISYTPTDVNVIRKYNSQPNYKTECTLNL